jgi:hypothetical protein
MNRCEGKFDYSSALYGSTYPSDHDVLQMGTYSRFSFKTPNMHMCIVPSTPASRQKLMPCPNPTCLQRAVDHWSRADLRIAIIGAARHPCVDHTRQDQELQVGHGINEEHEPITIKSSPHTSAFKTPVRIKLATIPDGKVFTHWVRVATTSTQRVVLRNLRARYQPVRYLTNGEPDCTAISSAFNVAIMVALMRARSSSAIHGNKMCTRKIDQVFFWTAQSI